MDYIKQYTKSCNRLFKNVLMLIMTHNCIVGIQWKSACEMLGCTQYYKYTYTHI